MRIGELAKATGASIRSLRYYEEQGLIQSVRSANGYREYTPFAADQVRSIQFYLSLGLTTEQIAGFLQCVMKNKEAFCREVLPVYEKKLAEMNEQIELLTRIRSNLIERIDAIHAEQQTHSGGIQV
ncbi:MULTISPECIES: MerR family transcriptional regulator [Paenibacillus]|uniref:MerR family transcriptional regulator n=1 Tax=Paenibacillus TaxID=44249 RepID=UPI0022B8A350|nr:MerR family transcriptional regulator [Paenibacillus caseinilyticus]MCZ8521986.1 MerR family transcriptional regulator [Paenibacillus caseinilyticus]